MGKEISAAQPATKRRREPTKVRGIYERLPGSGVWWITYRVKGKRRKEKAGTHGMAVVLLHKRKTAVLTGELLPELLPHHTVTVRELLDAAAVHVREHYSTIRISAKTNEPATDSRYPALVAAMGERPAADITPLEIERALSKIAAERSLSNASVNRYKAFLSLAYRLGVQNSLVPHNPVRAVRQRREDNGRIRFLSPEEEARLRAVIRQDCPEHEPELDLALNTGLRQGNQYSLRWEDVDFERRQIAITRTKNGHAHYAPLNQPAIDALLRLKATAGNSPWVIVNAAAAHSHYKGQPRRKPRNWFEPAVAKAGISEFPWHSLRHTFASRLVMAGVDLRTVQELLGHRTIQMTCRYAHLAPRHRLDAVEKLASFAGQTVPVWSPGGSGPAVDQAAVATQLVAVQ